MKNLKLQFKNTNNSTLKKIEKDIMDKMEEIKEKKQGIFFFGETADISIRSEQKKLEEEIKILELKRQHKLDRRSSWLPKTIWSIIAPIIVSLITYLILNSL